MPSDCPPGRHGGRTAPTHHPQRPGLFVQVRRYHRGDGVPANYAAIRLYQIAAFAGSRPAQHMLGLILPPQQRWRWLIRRMQQLATLDVEHDQGTQALSAQLPTLPAVSPQLYVHDPTPLAQ